MHPILKCRSMVKMNQITLLTIFIKNSLSFLNLAVGGNFPGIRNINKITALKTFGVSSRGFRWNPTSIWALNYFSNPNTATPFGVPTNTLPLAIMGVMNLLPLPKWSRPLAAWLLLYSM